MHYPVLGERELAEISRVRAVLEAERDHDR